MKTQVNFLKFNINIKHIYVVIVRRIKRPLMRFYNRILLYFILRKHRIGSDVCDLHVQSTERKLGANHTIFLVPRYIYRKHKYELTDEIVFFFEKQIKTTYNHEHNAVIVYFDEADCNANLENTNISIDSNFVYFFGPNVEFTPTTQQIASLSRHCNGLRIVIFSDAVRDDYLLYMNSISDYFEVFIGIDSKPPFKKPGKQFLGPFLPPFGDETYESVIKPNLGACRDIDVGIFGSKYQSKVDMYDYLKNNKIAIQWIGGGYGDERLSYADYLQLSCRTKIRIVSTKLYDQTRDHLKGHISEAFVTKTLLFIDNKHILTDAFCFVEDVDFVYFDSHDDLLKKILFFLNNESCRAKIANSGHCKFINTYSRGNFWNTVLAPYF